MNEIITTVLQRAANGERSALAGFGLERITVVPPGWEERLTLDEHGRVAVSTRRSLVNSSTEAIGRFSSLAGPDAVTRVLRLLSDIPTATSVVRV